MYTVVYTKKANAPVNVMTVAADCLERAIWIVKHLGYTVITAK